jgi:hypothetical protein
MARVITALNGRLPQSALAPIGGGFYLRKDAAASYLAARSAGCPWGVNTAYRTLAEQAKLYDKHLAGGSLAAKPGKSWHGEGLALDIPSASGAQQWLLSHPEYGWRRTVMPAEPWHFEYFPELDTREDDDVSVQQVIEALQSPAGKKALADAITGPDSRYQVRNPLKADQVWNLPTAAQVTLDYVLQIFSRVASLQATVAAQQELIAQLASNSGVTVDYDRIQGVVEAAIEKGIDVDVTVSQR